MIVRLWHLLEQGSVYVWSSEICWAGDCLIEISQAMSFLSLAAFARTGRDGFPISQTRGRACCAVPAYEGTACCPQPRVRYTGAKTTV